MRIENAGFRDLEAALGQITTRATRRNVGRRALRAAAEPIRAKAAQLAPDDPRTDAPYDLKTSIVVSSRQKSGRATRHRRESPTEVVVFIGPTKEGYPQAIMQEFGTKHHSARPYLRPAWSIEGGLKALDRIRAAMAIEIEKAIGRQARRAARRAARGGQ